MPLPTLLCSLLELGSYCMSPIYTALDLPPPASSSSGGYSVPDYSRSHTASTHPLDGSYRTLDGVLVQLCASRCLQDASPAWVKPGVDYSSEAVVRKLLAHCLERDLAIPHTVVLQYEDLWTKAEPNKHFTTAQCLVDAPPGAAFGFPKMSRW